MCFYNYDCNSDAAFQCFAKFIRFATHLLCVFPPLFPPNGKASFLLDAFVIHVNGNLVYHWFFS